MELPLFTTISVVALLLIILYKNIIYPAFVSPFAKVPNAHWSAPFSSAWILWIRFKSRGNRTIHAAHEKHGPIVRLAPSELSINCVDAGIKTVYTGGFEKHEWYPRVFASLGTVSMFTMTGNKAHSTRKRMLSNIYSKSTLQSSPDLRAISHTILFDRLLPILHEAASSSRPIDIYNLDQGLTMDFVSAYLFGIPNGTNFLQDQKTRQEMLHLYQCRKPYEFYHMEVPNLLEWTKRLGIRLIPKFCDFANSVLDEWNLDMCDKAEKSSSETKPGTQPVVYKQLKQGLSKQLPASKDDPDSYTDALKQQRLDIACELYDHLTAGHETSAVVLTYLFWELSKNPELRKELGKELQTLNPPIVFPGSSASHELPSPKSIDALPLLEAIVTETLRLHASIPGIQPRVTPYPSCTLAGYSNIPPNTRVNAQAYSLHRNPEVFPDPETWQPRRWLKDPTGSNDSKLEEMRRWFWAFGSGGRMCVGSNLALQEMKLVIAAVYTNFDTTVVEDDNMEATDAYTVKPKGEKLVLRFEPAQ